MFEGTDQFHHFIASSSSSSPPPSSSATNSLPPLSFPNFDSATPFTLHPNFLHPLHQPPPPSSCAIDDKHEARAEKEDGNGRTVEDSADPWSTDELLALLRVRSSLENWFPEFTWEHVSRKLAQLGFKRTPEKCKQKFTEESRFFNGNTIDYTKGYRGEFTELEQLCHADHHLRHPPPPPLPPCEEEDDKIGDMNSLEDSRTDQELVEKSNKKRKTQNKKKKLEMFKGLCEEFVRKMMSQQEEMHNKLMQDMIKRDEENVAREEAWRNQELERINKELEIRAQEQALAGDRQAAIINYLNKFSSSSQQQNPNPPTSETSKPEEQPLQNPNSINTKNDQPINKTHAKPTSAAAATGLEKDDLGKRWPRDEVLALINLRCKHYNAINEDKEGAGKAPLWERISQGMVELGYKRSAKRCKEKWENINKYFRKTKDVNKKRSVDSRTCPYFHQLSSLYNQGTLVAVPENHPNSPETGNSNSDSATLHQTNVGEEEGEKSMVHHQVVVPSNFDFEF